MTTPTRKQSKKLNVDKNYSKKKTLTVISSKTRSAGKQHSNNGPYQGHRNVKKSTKFCAQNMLHLNSTQVKALHSTNTINSKHIINFQSPKQSKSINKSITKAHINALVSTSVLALHPQNRSSGILQYQIKDSTISNSTSILWT